MPHPRQYVRQPAGGVSTTAGLFHCLVLSGSVLVLGGDLRACEHLTPPESLLLGKTCLPAFSPAASNTVSTRGPGHPESDTRILSRTRDVASLDGFT